MEPTNSGGEQLPPVGPQCQKYHMNVECLMGHFKISMTPMHGLLRTHPLQTGLLGWNQGNSGNHSSFLQQDCQPVWPLLTILMAPIRQMPGWWFNHSGMPWQIGLGSFMLLQTNRFICCPCRLWVSQSEHHHISLMQIKFTYVKGHQAGHHQTILSCKAWLNIKADLLAKSQINLTLCKQVASRLLLEPWYLAIVIQNSEHPK